MPKEETMRFIMIFLWMILLSAVMPLSADQWKVDIGAGVWNNTVSGAIKSTLNQTIYFKDNLTTNENQQDGYFYVSLSHPIPLLPNARLEYVNLNTTNRDIELGAHTTYLPSGISATSSSVQSSLEMRQYDAILFYNVIDQPAGVTLDLGLDLKYLLTDYHIDSVFSSSDSTIVPLIYAKGRVDIPVMDIGIEADGKFITDGSSTVYDLRFKVDYTMTFIPIVHPGLELGYRVEQFTSKGEESALIGPILSGKTDSDIGFSGFYGGVKVCF